jgi:hypothetical protein
MPVIIDNSNLVKIYGEKKHFFIKIQLTGVEIFQKQ